MVEVRHHRAGEAVIVDVFPKSRIEFIHGAMMTVAVWEFDENAIVPSHSHPHEQIIHCREGILEVTIAGETVALQPGDTVVVPGGVEHSAYARTEAKGIDAFCPVREDYRF